MGLYFLHDAKHHQSTESDVHTDPVEQFAPDQAEVGLQHKMEEMVEHDIQKGQERLHHDHGQYTSLGQHCDVEEGFQEDCNTTKIPWHFVQQALLEWMERYKNIAIAGYLLVC